MALHTLNIALADDDEDDHTFTQHGVKGSKTSLGNGHDVIHEVETEDGNVIVIGGKSNRLSAGATSGSLSSWMI